ncbi:hypothetical protein MOQ_004833 [Trypanosoma cruzi marinkellei]|uniref:Uncharacterized protein n=1 Tax=Trypanosoma cruzi marinkellei TaxID=85056 RepID=K2N937_TRYCR|nr:hypothetical protein MOQ_004833 [Trypanosoma cruzi marinkellei]
MQSGNERVPFPLSVMVVRQRYYPRVPPELLLREHAGKFHLSGFTTASLLDAISPQVRPHLPPFVTQKGTVVSANEDFMCSLIRENVKRPPVPWENIKEPTLATQRFKKKAAAAETKRHTTTVPPSSAVPSSSAKMGNEFPNECDEFIFEEATASYLTAVEFVRKPLTCNNGGEMKGQKIDIGKEQLHSRQGTSSRDATMEERESLWGYNTGAVLLVNLRSYAADIRSRLYYQTALTRAQSPYMDGRLDIDRESSIEGSVALSSVAEDQQKTNPSENDRYTQERKIFQDGSEKAPRGVLLLGYHNVGGVCSLVYDSLNDLAISGGVDGTLFVWDLHQRYRAALRDRYMKDEETKNMRPTGQFAAYVYTRRLTQRLSHAHRCAISSLATHCELLISGGLDGTVKIWSCLELEDLSARATLPRYVEQQVFTCNGWVRHIWSAPGRNVQGEDVFVTGENGFILGFKGRTVSQQPVVQTLDREKKLLNALRKSAVAPLTLTLGLNRMSSADTVSAVRFPSIGSPGLTSGNTNTRLLKPAKTEREATRLLQLGIITRALCLTRKLQTIGEEARLANSPAHHHLVQFESSSAITRIIPLVERNLFIVLGYSPLVRFLDMTRLSVAAVVIHPSLSTAAGEGKSDDFKASFSDNPQGVGKGNMKDTSHDDSQKKGRRMLGPKNSSKGNAEPLRFLDVLYITSYDYLVLLDNRNTVYVWDNMENKFLASWKSPDTNEIGKQKVALRLLPCGTRHYEGDEPIGGKRVSATVQYRAKRRMACFYEQVGALEESSTMEEEASGAITIPFFLLCSVGLELCGVVIEAQARLEVKAHRDTIVGIFLRQPPLFYLQENNEKKRTETKFEETDVLELDASSVKGMSSFSRKYVLNSFTRRSALFSESKRSGKTTENTDFVPPTEWSPNFPKKNDDDARIRVLSCSVDGTICFWGRTFEPLTVYDQRSLSEKNNEVCTTVSHKPLQFDGIVSPFDVPPCTTTKKKGVKNNVEHSECIDITSFYFSTRWNLAVTGHDDGSIRYWPCGKELATCVWHKGLHRNAVSGLLAARIMERIDTVGASARLGSIFISLDAMEPSELLASISFDGHLAVWENPQQSKAQLRGRTRVSFNELLSVAFDEINELFVIGDSAGTISSWFAKDLGPRHFIPSQPPSPWRPSTAVAPTTSFAEQGLGTTSIMLKHQQRRGASGRNALSAVSAQEPKERIGHTEAVTALIVDGNFVFSGGEDGRVFLWDLRMGVFLREYFLLHDVDDIAHHCRKTMSASTECGSTCSRENNPRSIVHMRSLHPVEVKLYSENVTCMVLLKRRSGNFLVATREGWIYHFEQSDSYPRSTYKHYSSVRCMCVFQDGCTDDDTVGDNVLAGEGDIYSGISRAFEVVVGDDEGKMALIREPYFFSTV